MKILENIGNFFLKSRIRLFFLVVILFGVFGLFFSFGGSNYSPAPSTSFMSPTPSLSQNNSPSNKNLEDLVTAKNRLVNRLPYETDKFTIEYFPGEDYFFVQIKKNPYSENKASVERFFKESGVEPEFVKIEWGSVRGVGP